MQCPPGSAQITGQKFALDVADCSFFSLVLDHSVTMVMRSEAPLINLLTICVGACCCACVSVDHLSTCSDFSHSHPVE